MRALIQRVSNAEVTVDGKVRGAIARGFLVFLGVGANDTRKEADFLAEKILHLRLFADDSGKMNLSVLDTRAALLVVSQFTLYGDCKKGRRPSFDKAAPPSAAREMYDYFVSKLQSSGLEIATGEFQAHMSVTLNNDGPVTIFLDSDQLMR